MRARAGLLLAGSLLVLSVLGGCDDALPDPPPGDTRSPETIALEEAPPERVFKGSLAGKPIHLIVHDCKVFRIDTDAQGAMVWTRVLETDPYPFAYCERQSLAADASSVVATLGRRAVGSGGCCAVGGTYRSRDGLVWKSF